LVILLSAFNGIETMIESLYSEFEPDITITAKKRKTFDEREINWRKIKNCKGISSFSKGLEEVVVLRHEKKWVNATLMGTENTFLKAIKINNHTLYGKPLFEEKNGSYYGIIGVGLMEKLNLYLEDKIDFEKIAIYAPKRNLKISFGKTPFYTNRINVSCAMNYNQEINQEKILLPLNNVRMLLNYSTELSHIYIDILPKISNDEMKTKIMGIVGDNFVVKTNYEKNELIFKTSKSERLIVIFIMIFIFILASFNLVASLTMLFVEKKENIKTLQSMGLTEKNIFKIFFVEGLLISGTGVFLGLLVGYIVCLLQQEFGLLQIPGAGMPFPVKLALKDFFLILFSVSTLSILFSYFTVKFLLKNLQK
jgi:lipoprotein-releasing system permease protein